MHQTIDSFGAKVRFQHNGQFGRQVAAGRPILSSMSESGVRRSRGLVIRTCQSAQCPTRSKQMWGNAVGPLSLFAKLEIANRALTVGMLRRSQQHSARRAVQPRSQFRSVLCSRSTPPLIGSHAGTSRSPGDADRGSLLRPKESLRFAKEQRHRTTNLRSTPTSPLTWRRSSRAAPPRNEIMR